MDPEQRFNKIRWGWLARSMPAPIVKVLRTIEVLGLRVSVAQDVERELFGWNDRRDAECQVDQARAHRSWARRWQSNPKVLMQTARRIVDERKRQAHQFRLQTHETAVHLRAEHQRPVPRDGVLTVRERRHRDAYFGLRTYLEVTPVEIPVYVTRFWQHRTGKITPQVWDLTAGSGTVGDVLLAEFAAAVIATDVVEAVSGTICADLFEAGEIARHKQTRAARENVSEETVIERPDLVFIDPPSRGTPTHTELDVGSWPERDLAGFERSAYLANILEALVRSVGRLASGGLVSVLLREGVRRGQRVEIDPDMIGIFLEAAAEFDLVRVDQVRIEEPWPLKQAGLAVTRMPMTHLLFEGLAQ